MVTLALLLRLLLHTLVASERSEMRLEDNLIVAVDAGQIKPDQAVELL